MHQRKQRKFSKRSIAALVLALFGLSGGAAFAVLQTQQNTFTGNTISTATANLQLSTDGNTYNSSHVGFDFNNVVPGGAAVPTTGYGFYLKNAGGTPLSLRLSVTSVPSNPNNVDLSKVNVILTTVGSGASPQTFSLQSLISSSQTGGISVSTADLAVGATQQYKFQVSMTADSFSGASASLGNIDFAFTGIVQ